MTLMKGDIKNTFKFTHSDKGVHFVWFLQTKCVDLKKISCIYTNL